MTITVESLEAERKTLQNKIEAQVFPCPSCGKNIRGMKWDKEEGGECVHCLGWIYAKEMSDHIECSHQLWLSLCKLSNRISEFKLELHMNELHRGLGPWQKFLGNGLREKDFTPTLYTMLSSTFNH